jgi:hypothetical protein
MHLESDTPKDGDYAAYVEARVRRGARMLNVPTELPGAVGAPASNPAAAPAAAKAKAQPAKTRADAALATRPADAPAGLPSKTKSTVIKVGVALLALALLWPVLRLLFHDLDTMEAVFFLVALAVVIGRTMLRRLF